jgi:hypothetical protein
LIALQIGSWNEDRKTKLSADTSRSKFINEWVTDTLNINQWLGLFSDRIFPYLERGKSSLFVTKDFNDGKK